jgi:hypothetical protein
MTAQGRRFGAPWVGNRALYFSLPRFGGGPGWGLLLPEVVEP